MFSILINAYACSPGMGSEPGMAWNWCVNLAKYCELHIITEGEFREKIEAELPTLPQGKNMHFYYNPVSEDIRRMCWNQGDWRFYYYYRRWQNKTLEVAQNIVRDNHIDIVHQLNMVGFREPGYLWKLDKPLVWGPIAGIGTIPYSFLKKAGLKFSLFFVLKNCLTNLQLRYSPRVQAILRKASYVITATPEAGYMINKYHGIQTVQINETGCFSKKENEISSIKSNDKFEVIWVGRFIYTKQLNLALETISQLKDIKDLRFHIVGQAFKREETEKYHQYAKKLGIQDICIWHGLIPNYQVHELMKRCHLFFFTSIFEATSTVILEALTNHLPIVCFDCCGFGPLIDEQIGLKIKLINPKQSVTEFAKAIEFLYHHKELLKEMSSNCTKRQEELSWDNKIKQMIELYTKTK